MEIYEWKKGMTPEQEAQVGYFERNMLALLLCHYCNRLVAVTGNHEYESGWYEDSENDWPGYKRVISIAGGRFTFHIPDEFDIGNLPEIKRNWDGHTTKEKWLKVFKFFGIRTAEEKKRRKHVDDIVEALREKMYTALHFDITTNLMNRGGSFEYGLRSPHVAETTLQVTYPMKPKEDNPNEREPD